jgi:hypothetical protein
MNRLPGGDPVLMSLDNKVRLACLTSLTVTTGQVTPFIIRSARL